MHPIILASDSIKDELTRWLTNALKCELFPREGDSLANAQLPSFTNINAEHKLRTEGDETHVIKLTRPDGQIFTVSVRYEGRGA